MAQTEPESTQVPPPFGITRTPLGDTITIAASGELDAATAPRLQEAINRDRKGCARLVLDLTALSFIDSMGLSVLLQAKKLSQEHGFDLFVIPSQHDEVKRLFDVTDAEQALRPDPDDEATPTG